MSKDITDKININMEKLSAHIYMMLHMYEKEQINLHYEAAMGHLRSLYNLSLEFSDLIDEEE